MNNDTRILQEQYRHDEETEPSKVWLVVVDESDIIHSGYDPRSAASAYNAELTELAASKYELGWVYENDYDPQSFNYSYRLFNPTETFEI